MTATTGPATTLVRCPGCSTRNRIGPIPSGSPACSRCHQRLPWVVDASEATFAAEADASVVVLVDLWAPWCAPCRMVAPVLERLAAAHAGRLKVVKVDIDRNPGLARRFGAQSIPLLVVLRDGREIDRVTGAHSFDDLDRRLASVLR